MYVFMMPCHKWVPMDNQDHLRPAWNCNPGFGPKKLKFT